MAQNEDKFRLNEYVSSTGILLREFRGQEFNYFQAREDDKLRVVIEQAGGTNQVVIRARINNAESFDNLVTITGPGSRTINISTYDEIQIETTLFDAPSGRFKIVASGFSIASGDIQVSAPAGVPSAGTNELSFTSDDSTVTITTDADGGINFSAPALVGANFKPKQVYTLTSTDISNKQIALGSIPATPNITQVFVIEGGICEYGSDFIVAGNTLTWNGLALDGELVAGEKLVIMHD